jgi:predicted porin
LSREPGERNGMRFFALVLALFLGWATVPDRSATAAEWSVAPSMEQKSAFNSNLFWDYQNRSPKSDFVFTFTPAAAFKYSTEVVQLEGRTSLIGLHYLSHPSVDHIDQNQLINGGYKVTPRLGLNLNASYIVDSTMAQEQVTSGTFATLRPRQAVSVTPGVSYSLTERTSLQSSYNYSRISYKDPGLRPYDQQQVNLTLSHLLTNQKTTLISNTLVRRMQYDSGDLFQSLGLQGGLAHKFSEDWGTEALAGVNLSRDSFRTQVYGAPIAPYYFIRTTTVQKKQSRTSPYFKVSLYRQWTNLRLALSYLRDEQATAAGAINETNNLSITGSYQFTERLSTNIMVGYYYSTQAFNTGNYKNQSINVNAGLNYKLTERFTSSLQYIYGFRNDMTNDYFGYQHIVTLMFNYSYPITYQK